MSALQCFIPYDKSCHFPIENLPYGVFSTKTDTVPRIGVAIGDWILDLKHSEDIFRGSSLKNEAHVFQKSVLNEFMALNKSTWQEARKCLQTYLTDGSNKSKGIFVKMSEATMHMPVNIGDYTDFFSSYYHALNTSKLFNIPIFKSNWSHMPLAYHGRSSSIVISGTEIKRPRGQIVTSMEQANPTLKPTACMDFELELGVFLGGSLNALGHPLPISNMDKYIFGMVLLNDWSARDIQFWEMVPLGPFLAKNFATTISPWIVTMDALQPFLTENMTQTPRPLPYLTHSDPYNFDIILEANIEVNGTVSRLSKTNSKHMYWTTKQQLCHHAISGCNMKPGDLLGSGTISGPTEQSMGCMLEISFNGKREIQLANGEKRTYLKDGDNIILTGYCEGGDYTIGFGDCSGKILASD